MKTYFLDVILKHYIDFKGRATPKQFWLFILFCFIFCAIVDSLTHTSYSIWLFLCPIVAISVRRMQDTIFSPWWLLVCFLVLVVSWHVGCLAWTPNNNLPDLGEGFNLIFYMLLPMAGLFGSSVVLFAFLVAPSKNNTLTNK